MGTVLSSTRTCLRGGGRRLSRSSSDSTEEVSKKQKHGGEWSLSRLDDDALIALLARLPFASCARLRTASRRCGALLDRVSQHRAEISMTEETVLAVAEESRLWALSDGEWKERARCPLSKCEEWHSSGSILVARAASIAIYDSTRNVWKIILDRAVDVCSVLVAKSGVLALSRRRPDDPVALSLFSFDTNAWTTLSDDDVDVGTLAAVVGNVVYAFGSSRVCGFDLDSRKWNTKARIPEYRFDSGKTYAVDVSGKLYGFRIRETSSGYFELSRMWIYNPSRDSFELAPPALDGLSSGFLVPLNNNLLLSPLPHDRAHQSNWILDVSKKTWSRARDVPSSLPGATFSCLLPIRY